MSVGPELGGESNPNASTPSALRDELRALIRTWKPTLPVDVDDHTSLIASGLIDSLALFNLVLWIEGKSGRTLDPTSVDVASEWDSISAIVRYLDRSDEEPSKVEASRTFPDAAHHDSNYQIVKYDPQYSQAVAEFQTGLWSSDPNLNLRYLTWKYETSPYAQAGRIYLALLDGKIVGMRGFYGSLWQGGGSQMPLLVADDLLVSQEHRNRGLVNQIMRSARGDLQESGHDFILNLSGGPLTMLESLAMGWRSAGMLRIRSCEASGRALSARIPRLLSRLPYARRYSRLTLFARFNQHPFSRLDRATNPYKSDLGLNVECDSQPRPREMADLIARIGYDGRFRHIRDETYLAWRYSNPFRDYRFLYVADSQLSGYLVLARAVERVSPRVAIVDLEAADDRVRSGLLEAAVRSGAFGELIIGEDMEPSETTTSFRALGFRPSEGTLTAPVTPQILVWSLADSLGNGGWRSAGVDLLNPSNWDMRLVYSMAG